MKKSAFYKIPLGLLPIVIIFWNYFMQLDQVPFKTIDYFSLFTIISNILGGIVLIFSAFKFKTEDKQKLDYLRGMNASYLIIVGIVYFALIADTPGFSYLALDHSNVILHRLMPFVLLLDFAFDRPDSKFEYKKTLLWMIIPLSFVAYSLIRGPIAKWYPYEFLDPGEVGGYIGVAEYCIAISIGFLFFGYGIYYLCNCRRKPVNS